jgi:DNA-binding NtrC family response regulator
MASGRAEPVSDDTASIPGGQAFEPGPENLEWVHALIMVWAGEEWSRVGEVATFDMPGATFSIGRDDDSPGGHRRARWVRQRPAENGYTPPLVSTATSRDQLLVTSRVYGLDLENVGSCRLEEGSFVQIQGQFLFRCIRRPLRMAPARHFAEKYMGPFGEANAFGMVGETPEMWTLLEHLAFAAKVPDHVLLRGQTGTGKESAAEAIHAMSLNALGPFISMSIGNIPRSLFEDALFGHLKDYPQAGMRAKKGAVGEADGGSLFLDEIADLTFDAQTALLRLLDQGEYLTLGGEGRLRSELRLIGAMNRELEALKLDLRKRLSTHIDLPPLTLRRDDVPLILRHLLKRAHARTPGLTQHLVTPQADGTVEVVPPVWFVERLMRQETYEGNVRDLIAAVNQLLEQATPPPGPAGAKAGGAETAGAGAGSKDAGEAREGAGDEARGALLTKDEVEWCLARTGGNVSAAAKAAGVSRPAFYRAMSRLGVKRGKGE